MSDTDSRKVAQDAERDLNSYAAKAGKPVSDTAAESGVDAFVQNKFPGSGVTYGSEASGAGDNRDIPESEGGGQHTSGRSMKAKDFEGEGGPEVKSKKYDEEHGGRQDARSKKDAGDLTR